MLLGIGATQIEFATGQDSYLNSDSQIAIDNREFQDLFGGEAVILLFSATDDSDADISDLFVGDNLADDAADQRSISATIDEVESVVSPLTSLTFSEALIGVDEFGPAANALLARPGRDPERCRGPQRRHRDQPRSQRRRRRAIARSATRRGTSC